MQAGGDSLPVLVLDVPEIAGQFLVLKGLAFYKHDEPLFAIVKLDIETVSV